MYLLVENFNQGIDTRKMLLTTKAGSLITCTNAHITRGGEIEKRKAFVNFASLPAGTFGMQSTAGNLYFFGSQASPAMPTGTNYQQLLHPAAANMNRVLYSENFNGKIYVIAGFEDGSIYHYYNGSRVTSWDGIYASVADKSGVASSFALLIDQEAPFSATSLGDTVTISAVNAGVPFGISKSTINGGVNPDQDIVLTNTVANVPGVDEVLAVGSFSINGGTAGAGNQITSVKVNAVTVTSAAVLWATSNEATATAVAANITAFASSPKYTAVAVGTTVYITASAGTGATPNGFVVLPTPGGTVTVTNIVNMAGGVTAVTPVAEVYTAQIVGTFEAADIFSITLTVDSLSYNSTFTVSGSASGMGRSVKTFKSKMYSTTRSLLYFCEINDPTAWNTNIHGSGFINITNEDAGSEDLSGMGIYQGKLAVFSRRAVQIWNMDADPTQNIQSQILNNIGTIAPKSIVSFGDVDVFFLADSGVRSLKARDASNSATVSDIGTNIDTLIAADLSTLAESVKAAAVGIVEPTDGRYWLAVGTKIYVYSYFATPGISAWSTYEPGFTISDFAYASGRLYARSGDTVYVYGGVNGTTYDDCRVEVVLPYMDGGKPAHRKTLKAFDISCEGTWEVRIGMDNTRPDAKDIISTITGSSWEVGCQLANGIGTHIGVQLISESQGYARIGNFAAHFTINDAS